MKSQPHSSKASLNGVHHSHKTTASVHAVSHFMDTPGLVQGQHSLNQSRRAVLRHVKPEEHHGTFTDSRMIQPQDLLNDSPYPKKNSSSLLKPGVHMMPVCQKCGWKLTPSQGNQHLPGPAPMDMPLLVDAVDQHYEEHSKVVDHSATNVYSTLKRETVINSKNHGAQNGGGPYSSSHQGINHGMHSHSSTDSAQEQSTGYQLSPRQRTTLTTSRLCHHKASQTELPSLDKDISSSGELGKQTPGIVEHSKSYTRAKPPLGRPPRADTTLGSIDTGDVTPLQEAVKSGNLDRLVGNADYI